MQQVLNALIAIGGIGWDFVASLLRVVGLLAVVVGLLIFAPQFNPEPCFIPPLALLGIDCYLVGAGLQYIRKRQREE